MAAPVVTCGRCHTPRVYKRIQTALLGTVPVELGICDCDFPSCQRDGCHGTLRGVPASATRCPHCNGLLWQA
jgi:hypothetical protein